MYCRYCQKWVYLFLILYSSLIIDFRKPEPFRSWENVLRFTMKWIVCSQVFQRIVCWTTPETLRHSFTDSSVILTLHLPVIKAIMGCHCMHLPAQHLLYTWSLTFLSLFSSQLSFSIELTVLVADPSWSSCRCCFLVVNITQASQIKTLQHVP